MTFFTHHFTVGCNSLVCDYLNVVLFGLCVFLTNLIPDSIYSMLAKMSNLGSPVFLNPASNEIWEPGNEAM